MFFSASDTLARLGWTSPSMASNRLATTIRSPSLFPNTPTTRQFRSPHGSMANGAIKSPAWTTRSTPSSLKSATARLTFGMLSWLSDITPIFIILNFLFVGYQLSVIGYQCYTISKRSYCIDRSLHRPHKTAQANSLCYKRVRLLKHFRSEMVLVSEESFKVY